MWPEWSPPLAVLALVWDRRDWGSSKWLQGRQITLHLGRYRRRLAVGSFASAVLLIVMAILTYFQAAVGPGMTSGGWLAQFGADLQHSVSVATKALAWLPGWAVAIALVASGGYFVWRATRHTEPKPPEPTLATPDGPAQSADSESSCCSDAALETPARTGQDTTK
ncbi:hypothetical protein QN354_04070 [Cryobacterium sp. 5I3]|uniref:hypothetical protein n=1 Tax=Cryobacterium sp. 5I3 TaxID=3048592 RepID=UPI002B23C887|nr:hypothetical protein [Cryobacterium sp. 5I3]MEB0200933.1 hypothetical protein [Cryobacterium sp. 5I3]